MGGQQVKLGWSDRQGGASKASAGAAASPLEPLGHVLGRSVHLGPKLAATGASCHHVALAGI